MTAPPGGAGAATLRPWQAVAIVVGIVVGAGIFKTPALVAGQVPSVGWMLALWAAGGLLTLCGALVYAELSTTWPSHAGEYHFLGRAWGRPVASLYAWARFTVITTGSLVLLGYVYGDYATQLLPLGPHSAAWHAGLAIAVLTALNLRSLRSGANAQALMTALELLGAGGAPSPGCCWSRWRS
ncbi:amino acid permease [Piscinibacter sakaiensis]|uniref:amino acid permease n=1 Tax=Piscinibacter sakaiensis TaxID=1547922 RepID=UPI0037264166